MQPSLITGPRTTASDCCKSSSSVIVFLGLTYKISGAEPERLEKDLNESFRINVVGNVHLFNLFLPLIQKGQAKKVIYISSGMADIDLISKYSVQDGAPYSISKAAGNAAVAKFDAQYRSEGILFMSISPGVVDTQGAANC